MAQLQAVRPQAPGLPLDDQPNLSRNISIIPKRSPCSPPRISCWSNIHPVFEPWFKSATADNWTDFVVRVMARLEAIYAKPILVKETGVPTGPASAGFSPDMQRAFYDLLAKRLKPSHRRAFAYFTAFDEPWRPGDFNPTPGAHPEEAYWGLFTETRGPKPVINDLPKLPR